MQTQILLTITHSKPLPKDAEEEIARKFYGWSYARGVEVGVTARLMEIPRWCDFVSEERSKVLSGPLSLDEPRCIGHGAGPTGHQNRVDCVNCLRRLAPRPSGVKYLPLPMEFPCPQRIGANDA